MFLYLLKITSKSFWACLIEILIKFLKFIASNVKVAKNTIQTIDDGIIEKSTNGVHIAHNQCPIEQFMNKLTE